MLENRSGTIRASDRLREQQRPVRPTIIRRRAGVSLGLAELWRFRELAVFLAWRDFAVRYKQTALGVIWVLFQPLVLTLIFSLVFGGLANLPSDGHPYAVFVFAGLVPWQLFGYTLTQTSLSVVSNERLITKVYFPRLVIPIASSLSGVVDVAVSMTVLFAMILLVGIPLSATWLLAPVIIMSGLLTAMGVGLWLAALNVEFRDVRYTLPFLAQIWMFATPVVYPVSVIPEPWRAIVSLNPMTSVVEAFRWATLGSPFPDPAAVVASSAMAVLLLLTGALYFNRLERRFADVI